MHFYLSLYQKGDLKIAFEKKILHYNIEKII